MTEPTALVDIAEACRLLGLSKSTLYGEIRTRRLRSIKVGARRLVPRTAIDAWISDQSDALG